MLLRLAIPFSRRVLLLSQNLPKASYVLPTRQIHTSDQIKRKILLKINTSLSEAEDLSDSDATNIACLNNDLIVSERLVKFPFHYRCLLEQQLSICSDRWVSADEWRELYDHLGAPTKPLFASITMLVCAQLKQIDRGRSLFRFIEECHANLLLTSATTSATYMQLLSSNFFQIKGKQHQADYSTYEKEILQIYQKYIQTKQPKPILTSAAALGMIKGLCVTSRWREAYTYLPLIDDANQLQAMTDLILACLHNDDLDAGRKLVENLKVSPASDSAAATCSTLLTEMVRDMFRNLNAENTEALPFIEKLFRYLSTLDYFVEKSAVEEMQDFFSTFPSDQWKFGSTIVYPNGTCKTIPNLSLRNSDLSEEEFALLRKYLLESAYVDKEVYNTTTPKEFDSFKNFLSRNQFTMIIDGLNILYGIDRFATDPVRSMVKTIDFLRNLRLSSKQMLFIARKHALSRIPPNIQNDLRSLCKVFLVDDTSRDDWFVLYAAFQSKAYVLTSDILRKERGIANKSTPAKNSLVNQKLQRWLYRYQYMFIRQNNRVYFRQPMGYELRAQRVNQTWLIPYFTVKPSTLAQRPDQWFFVSKAQSLN